jgi:predicted RNA methylase
MAARTTFNISDEVRDVLARSTITATSVKLPDGQLERKLYEAVNKALEGAGGRWDRKSKTHLFDRDPREALGLAVETGKALNLRTKLQAFYTPPELAEKMVAATGIAKHRDVVRARAGDRFARPLVLEPSVGEGALAVALIKSSAGQVALTACDTDEVALKVAEPAIVAAYKAEGVKAPTCQIHAQDFLLVSAHDSVRYDFIVMNPPFTGGADMAHVMHAWKLLAEGGVLVALTSPAWKTANTKAAIAFRDFVAIHNTAVEDIPPGTFKHTDIATVMVVLRKPEPPSGR